MLTIKNLHVKLAEEDKIILRGVDLTIGAGEVHAIMGPNGSGKSTLSYVLSGRDGYEVTDGEATLDEGQAMAALEADIERIAAAADETLAQAGVARDQVDALYFTGGSTGLKPLAARIAARFPDAKAMRGDRFASVAQGLGIHARRLYGARDAAG